LEKLVPSGKRSRIINEALRKELISLRRRRAVEQLAASSSVGKKYSNREILNGLAKDRRAR
jgi:hypothetical protein